MCGIRSCIILLALVIFVRPAAGSAAGDGPPTANLCGRLDPSSRLEGLEYYGIRASKVQEQYRYSGGLETLWDGIPGFLSELEQRDPAMRIEAVARIGLAISWVPPSKNTDELVQRLIDRLRRETQGQVIEEIIRVVSQKVDTPGLAPILVELIRCDRDPGLRSAALDVASAVPDPAMLEPLLEVWRTDAAHDDRAAVLRVLARLRDRRSLDVAMKGLKEGFVEAVALMRAVGTQQDVASVIEIYKEYPRRLTMLSGGVLELIGDLGGFDALAFLRKEFERSEGDYRSNLARLALRAQLERGKPEWTEADQRNCVPLEEIRKRRLPFVQKDVERLLREENEPFFRLLTWQAYREIGGSLTEWSRHLDPSRRVEHWRRVVNMLGGDPSKKWSPAKEPTVELAKALASRASLEAPDSPTAALRDIDEALSLSRMAAPNDSTTDRLLDVRVRVERLLRRSSRGTVDAASAPPISGTYRWSNGLEAHTLALNADGSFEFSGQSDAIGGCTGGRWSFVGSFHLEEGYLALEPGPSMRRYWIDAPDLLMPVVVGDRPYLVEEPQLAEFCRLQRAGKLPEGTRFFYVGSPAEGSVESMSEARAVCAARE